MKTNIQNDFKKDNGRIPKKLQMTLHLFYKYTKNPVVIQPTPEGVAFAQKGNMNKNKEEHYDKNFWKDKKW